MYSPGRRSVMVYVPLADDSTERVSPVVVDFAVIVAFGTPALVGSRIVPAICPVYVCEKAGVIAAQISRQSNPVNR